MVVPSPSPSLHKSELRKIMRSQRRAFVAALDPAERERLEGRLAEMVWPLVERARILAGYEPMGSEISPKETLWRAGNSWITTALPAFLSKESLMIFRSGQCAEDCPVGGVQPPHQAKEVLPDLVLVPLLAIDPAGHRLGQGGGHYDRVLQALRAAGATLIGIGWDFQRLDFSLPHDPWDVALDGFASPSGLEMFR
jgi:5-formyltetrahydrofolate cyclo-ligase